MEQKEFQIEAMPNYSFRTKKLRAIEINAIAQTLDLDSIQATIQTQDFILEHLEVSIKGVWTTVKQKNDYWPATLEDDVIATKQLVGWFLNNVVYSAFQKSGK